MEYSSLFQKSVCIFPFISFGIFGVKIFNISTINIIIRVEQLVSEHLSTQRSNEMFGHKVMVL
jgi:hypothetical protein